eukprot:1999407-Pleurochrysis_carterae.AAC.1
MMKAAGPFHRARRWQSVCQSDSAKTTLPKRLCQSGSAEAALPKRTYQSDSAEAPLPEQLC